VFRITAPVKNKVLMAAATETLRGECLLWEDKRRSQFDGLMSTSDPKTSERRYALTGT
jgi:hypothetical protein